MMPSSGWKKSRRRSHHGVNPRIAALLFVAVALVIAFALYTPRSGTILRAAQQPVEVQPAQSTAPLVASASSAPLRNITSASNDYYRFQLDPPTSELHDNADEKALLESPEMVGYKSESKPAAAGSAPADAAKSPDTDSRALSVVEGSSAVQAIATAFAADSQTDPSARFLQGLGKSAPVADGAAPSNR